MKSKYQNKWFIKIFHPRCYLLVLNLLALVAFGFGNYSKAMILLLFSIAQLLYLSVDWSEPNDKNNTK